MWTTCVAGKDNDETLFRYTFPIGEINQSVVEDYKR